MACKGCEARRVKLGEMKEAVYRALHKAKKRVKRAVK